ncbi:MAG: DUF885 family protein [Planctomycetota bacterium]|nr:DUF885 family protein [Planctomycetota bacterium]
MGPLPQDPARLMPARIERYEADLGAVRRLGPLDWSNAALDRMEAFLHVENQALLAESGFENFGLDDRVDYSLLRNLLEHEIRELGHERTRQAEVEPLLSFAAPLIALVDARLVRELAPAAESAETLDAAVRAITALRAEWKDAKPEVRPTVAGRAAERCEDLQRALSGWYRFYADYDPGFTWWCEEPWGRLERALGDFARHLRKEIGGLDPDDPTQLLGDPIGREALLDELRFEMIPYSPEELVAIAERELAWCRARWEEAAAEMGYGDDRAAALAAAKEMHVAPGGQPEMILMLAQEAVDFVERNQLVTVPELCKDSWRMEMMSPQRQKYTPYFTGGEVISISFPTAGMEHGDKLMSLRSNNLPFCRATVHHELIPGHHLQGFMSQRNNTHRRPFRTPFLGEGWALWWELLLWDMDFFPTPEDRVGALFWRSHRCARIMFSLNFHLGKWTPQECVDFLVAEVGHERSGAEAEVRRSIQGGYGPLYQCAYMVGGLQLRALHRELVTEGGWSERDFHDAVLRQNSIPVEMIRATLTGRAPAKEHGPTWRFDDAR